MQMLYCQKCGEKLYKNGVDRKGRMRFRCKNCGASFSTSKPKTTKTNWRRRYEKYLLGKITLNDLSENLKLNAGSIWRHFSQVKIALQHPKNLNIAGKPLIIDGIFHSKKVTLIAARSSHEVYSWSFADRENADNWTLLLSSLQGVPLGIVGDGQKGMFKAIHKVFPGVVFQRCQAHVIAYICKRLGQKPTEPHKRYLRALAKYVAHVKTINDLFRWFHFWDIWKRNYEHLALEKVPYVNKKCKVRLKFRYDKLHEAYAHLRYALPYLFNYLFFPGLPNTSNDVEGGINAPIKELLRLHRGAKLDTQKKIISLFLHSK